MQRRKASRKIIKLFFSQIIFLFTRHPLINSDERLIYLTYPSYPSSSFFLVVRAGLATEDYLQPLPPPPTKLYKKSCEHTEAEPHSTSPKSCSVLYSGLKNGPSPRCFCTTIFFANKPGCFLRRSKINMNIMGQ